MPTPCLLSSEAQPNGLQVKGIFQPCVERSGRRGLKHTSKLDRHKGGAAGSWRPDTAKGAAAGPPALTAARSGSEWSLRPPDLFNKGLIFLIEMDRPPRRGCAGLWRNVSNKAAPDSHAPHPGLANPNPQTISPRRGELDSNWWYRGQGGETSEATLRDGSQAAAAATNRAAVGPPRDRVRGRQASESLPRRETAGGRGSLRGGGGISVRPSARLPRAAPEPRRPHRVSSRLALPSTHHLRRGYRRDAGQGVGGRRVSSQQRSRATQRGGDAGREPTKGRARERAAGPNTTAHVTRCPPLLRNRKTE